MSVGLLTPTEADQELNRAIQAADKSPAGTMLAELAFGGLKPWKIYLGQQSVKTNLQDQQGNADLVKTKWLFW